MNKPATVHTILSASLMAAALLGACASPPADAPTAAAAERSASDNKLAAAVVAPLTDLNLVRAPIPPVLSAALKAPYALPADRSCAALAGDVRALDAVLGADLDTPPTGANPSLIERGVDAAGDAVVGTVRDTTEKVVPLRGWVRKLSGAERYSKEVAAAIAAGTIRRAYLKGLGHAGSCGAPAAPRG